MVGNKLILLYEILIGKNKCNGWIRTRLNGARHCISKNFKLKDGQWSTTIIKKGYIATFNMVGKDKKCGKPIHIFLIISLESLDIIYSKEDAIEICNMFYLFNKY